MNNGVEALSEREKEALRLLFGGHDAKSAARVLGLSVHTLNERLREARRKLEVSSSRQAARLLAETEGLNPNSLGDKQFGVAASIVSANTDEQSDKRRGKALPLAWLAGGMLLMSLIVAAIALSFTLQGAGSIGAEVPDARSLAASTNVTETAGTRSARDWVALVDGQQWEESWNAAASIFRSQLTATQWAATVQPLRQSLGAVSSRTLQNVTRTNSLPGAPAGEYEVAQFKTNFATKADAIETIVLIHEDSAWKVAGYFIR